MSRSSLAFANLSSDSFSGFRIEGDASEAATLERAGIGQADWLVAATQDDNLNLMVAMVARELHGVSRVVARAYDPHRVDMYSQLGLPTVCPTVIAGERLLDAMASPPPVAGGAA
ncbi:MAG: TrkA family potassium uptake protein [Planctomycetes bacterium]|nr:TrkA family potassium uptake protein [Planctomycetota bacterium]